jgi:neutral ceramidase
MLKNRKILKFLLYFLSVLVALAVALVAPINRTPMAEQSFYQQAMKSLDTLPISTSQKSSLKAGWAKVNITPKGQMPMAGYMPRDHYDTIHDSLYVRIMLLASGRQTIALINADLLLFPPALKQRLQEKLADVMPNVFLYLSATHTHNGIGAWDDTFGGQIAIGDFDYQWINQTADQIIAAMQHIETQPASVGYWERDATEYVRNRIAYSKGKKDGKLRGLVIERSDSSSACLFTYSAHATSISKFIKSISADYPGAVIEQLEKKYDFGMFMSGMVGSHSFIWYPEVDFELITKERDLVVAKMDSMERAPAFDSAVVTTRHIPIPFGPAQLRVSEDWKTRNWAFSAVLDDLEGELTYLQMGNILMIGTPCDFSGEIAVNEKLHEYAKAKGLNLIITSFNGNYVGYITHDGHYDSINRSEVREMNWVGPYYGQYFAEMIKKLIDKTTVH